MKEIEFHHGALCDTYEKQANAQGFTFGDKAEWVQDVGFGLVCLHIHGCITDSEYDKILRRFQTKILLKNLKANGTPIEEETNLTSEELFDLDIEQNVKDIDSGEDDSYYRGRLAGMLSAYRILKGKPYEEKETEVTK